MPTKLGTSDTQREVGLASDTCIKGNRAAFVATLLAVLTILIVTAPSQYYPGDNFATRAEAGHFLQTGEFGIGQSHKEALGDFVLKRGQYFFENDARGRLYSKYGIAYTALYMVPMKLEQLLGGPLELIHSSGTLLLLLMAYNLIFSAIIVTYLYLLASLCTRRLWLRATFVIASVFGTFLWFYLRGFAHDIFQVGAFLAFSYHTLAFVGKRSNDSNTHVSSALQLLAGTISLGLLIHMRFSYALLYVPLWATALAAGPLDRTLAARIQANLRRSTGHYAWALVLPSVAAVGLLMWVQWWKFGSPFDHGYGQWHDLSPVESVVRRPVSRIPHMLYLYFVAPGNANVFVHYPLVALAALGGWHFWRRNKQGGMFIVSAALCVLLPVLDWTSEGHGYGPRYLLPALALVSLMSVAAVEWLLTWCSRWTAACLGVVTCSVLAWSCTMQVNMNGVPYFAYFYVRDEFRSLATDETTDRQLDTYLQPAHRGAIHHDLISYRSSGEFKPAIWILQTAPPEKQRELRQHLQKVLESASVSNYLFLPTAAPRNSEVAGG